jgi:hypothetical protein
MQESHYPVKRFPLQEEVQEICIRVKAVAPSFKEEAA